MPGAPPSVLSAWMIESDALFEFGLVTGEALHHLGLRHGDEVLLLGHVDRGCVEHLVNAASVAFEELNDVPNAAFQHARVKGRLLDGNLHVRGDFSVVGVPTRTGELVGAGGFVEQIKERNITVGLVDAAGAIATAIVIRARIGL